MSQRVSRPRAVCPPARGIDAWLAWTLKLNPLSYGVSALRQALDMEGFGASVGVKIASEARRAG